MDARMQMVAVCHEFHWTFQEYMSQPAEFLYLIKQKLIMDNKERELERRKSKRG